MSKPILQLQNLTFAWPGANHLILNGINLDLYPGESIQLLGSNGSGKTTLFNCVTGLLPLASGRIIFNNAAISSKKDFQRLRLSLGYCLQTAADQIIFPTVLEDVSFGPLNQGLNQAEACEQAESTLDIMGIADFASRLTTELSSGELRLVALAGILAMKPQVLLLDEPFAGLDQQTSSRLLTILQGLECAIILVEHDPAIGKALCPRRVKLIDGKLFS